MVFSLMWRGTVRRRYQENVAAQPFIPSIQKNFFKLFPKYLTRNKCDNGKQNRMRCKAASAPQCEHCKQEPTQQRAGYGSQKHIYLWAST
jgi:hypothetical protein